MYSTVKLRDIRNHWFTSRKKPDSRPFLLSILPDSYNGAVCSNPSSSVIADTPHQAGFISNQDIGSIMRGNMKSPQDPRLGNATFTKDLRDRLIYNETITFLDENRPNEGTVENMLKKIRTLITQNNGPYDRDHPLFRNIPVKCMEADQDDGTYGQIQVAIASLLELGSEQCIEYAVFLLIVTAILQYYVKEAAQLYSPETIDMIRSSSMAIPVEELERRHHIPFTDKDYMHEYHVYFYRDGYITSSLGASSSPNPRADLWIGKLTMSMEDGRPRAVMQVSSQIEAPMSGEKSISREFRGTPMLSGRDEMVYIGMTDPSSSFMFLTFAYTKFNNAEMYFRSGLLVSSAPETKYPVAQKIVITSKELDDQEIPYVRGLLKTGGKQLLISEEQYRAFLNQFAEYGWMKEFKKRYTQLFKAHKMTFYRFSEEELRGCSTSELDYQDRLRVLLAIQSMDSALDIDLNKFVESIPPSRTHTIMK